jgi:uncharacterized integral membrane protein (TIGR00697 family)
MPPAPSYTGQDAFHTILGFLPRIVAASLFAYLFGQLVNSFILVKIKEMTKGRRLWLRLISSTLAGEAIDTAIFCTIAFFGVLPFPEFLNYMITGYVYKCALEIVLLPVTYRVIGLYKR